MSQRKEHVYEVVVEEVQYRSIWVWASSQTEAKERYDDHEYIVGSVQEGGGETGRLTAKRDNSWFGPDDSTRIRNRS